MTAPAIEPGLKGTLSPEEYSKKTMPHWGQIYPSGIASYRNIDFVSIAFATDADKAAALIPKELQLLKIPGLPSQAAANLAFAKYRECALGPYMEVIISIPVLHKGQTYGYIPAIYVDNDAALVAGRELGGYPKKMAQITMRNYGNLFLSHISRGSMQQKTADPNFSDLASSSVTKGAKLFSVPLAADQTVQLPPPYNLLLPLPPARRASPRTTPCRR
jgi:acetoacetate decarboxylase